MSLLKDLQSLSPTAVLELFTLDMSIVGGPTVYFHAGTNELNSPVIWQGITYSPYPIQVSGFEYRGQGKLPRPTIRVANVTGSISAFIRDYNDLLGCKVVRKRTFSKYLDAINFPSGNPDADTNQQFMDDVFFIDRKVSENKILVEFELSVVFDVHGVKLPRRQIIQNVCPWKYKGGECGYVPGLMFDSNDQPVSSAAEDSCGKRIKSCKLRFGAFSELPYGGFPAAGLTK
jgi:lambda family phage minor tail protein L